MKRALGIAGGILFPLFFLVGLYAGSGTTGGLTLNRLGGARPTGMGETFASVSGDVDAALYNPAGLADLPLSRLTATYFRGFAQDDLGTVGYGQPIPWGTLYAGVGYFDAGIIDVNLSSGLKESRTAQKDTVGMVGFGIGRNSPFLLGILGKFYRFELAEEAHTSGAALDAGLQYKTFLRGFQLGASVQNVGSDVKFEKGEDPLPTTVRYGGSYLFSIPRIPFSFRVLADGVSQKNENSALHAGIELRQPFETNDIPGAASLRGGYISGPNSYTVGVGFQLGLFILDYGIKLLNDLNQSHRVTVAVEFGHRRD